MTYDNRDKGVLFKNKQHEKDSDCDYRGEINVAGETYWLSAWIRTSKAGERYMSLSVRPKEVARLNRMSAEDEHPF